AQPSPAQEQLFAQLWGCYFFMPSTAQPSPAQALPPLGAPGTPPHTGSPSASSHPSSPHQPQPSSPHQPQPFLAVSSSCAFDCRQSPPEHAGARFQVSLYHCVCF